jgi:catechol 2,3-dioxygenase-like lactoylglutathione lyase family enzyme
MVRAVDAAFVRFRAPDLARMEEFLIDFGLVRCGRTESTLYMRGTDPAGPVHVTERGDPGFAAVGFLAESRADLEALAASGDATAIEPLDGPGGGERVRLTDPDGFAVEVVHGRTQLPPLSARGPLPRNDASGAARVGVALRLERGPAHVKRLGHVVLRVRDFRTSERWYKDHLGFLTSDEVRLGDTPVAAFLRCDRGAVATDHHTFVAAGLGEPGFDHAAFEVLDFDDLMLGHDHLRDCGHDHSHGVGRHILGSQIFDYWNDPWGHMVEHWTDGDRFDASAPANLVTAESALGSQWGSPSVPAPRAAGAPPGEKGRGR